MGCVPLHIGFQLIDSACCESLSQKSKIFASSLWQGSRGVPPQSISHGSFLRIVTSLTRPVSAGGARRQFRTVASYYSLLP